MKLGQHTQPHHNILSCFIASTINIIQVCIESWIPLIAITVNRKTCTDELTSISSYKFEVWTQAAMHMIIKIGGKAQTNWK